MRVLAAALLALAVVPGAAEARRRVLVLSATKESRHASIPAGRFTERRLRRSDAIVFLSTTGDVLDGAQRRHPDVQPATMGARHPIAWCREFEGGRSW